jgi:hypothetical protein
MKDTQETKDFSSASLEGTFKMSDNGKVVAEVTGNFKGNKDGKEASGNVQVNLMGKEQVLSFFGSEDATYLVDETNARYYQFINMDQDMPNKHEAFSKENGMKKHQMGKAGEALMDNFVGDLKSQFGLSQNADGTRSITLDLDQNEIPASINLLVGVAVENKDSNFGSDNDKYCTDTAQKELLLQKMPFLKEFGELSKELPQLKQNVKLTSLYLKLNVDENNQIKSFDIKMNTTGEDANGAYHEIAFTGSAAVEGLNSTTVDTFNTDGKSIETIDVESFKDRQE